MTSIGQFNKFASWRPVLSGLVLLAVLSTDFASAAGLQSLVSIQQAASAFLKNEATTIAGNDMSKISVTPPDRRLRVPACTHPLIAFRPEHSQPTGNTTVAVRCLKPRWQLYLSARVEQYSWVWVASRTLRRGDPVTASALKKVRRVVTGAGSELSPAVLGTGVRANRHIQRGHILASNDICQVCKGDRVELLARAGQLTVQMAGLALNSGLSGDIVNVMNTSTKKRLSGVVAKDGQVRVSL